MQTATNNIMELKINESILSRQFAKVKLYLEDFSEFIETKSASIVYAFRELIACIKDLPEVYALTHGSWKGNPAPNLTSSEKAFAVVSLIGSTAFLSVAAALA